MAIIYRITNKENGRVYVGQTHNSAENRWKAHIGCANRGDTDYPLHRALRKHGVEGFVFEVIEECPDELLDEREIAWIAELQSLVSQNGYNLTYGGKGRVKTDRDAILEAILETPCARKVAAKLGCDPTTVCRVAAAHGIPLNDPGEPSKAVHQFSLGGNYIRSFASLREAVKHLIPGATTEDLNKITPHVSKAARGKLKQSLGYQWRYEKDMPNPFEGIPPYQAENAKKRVAMYDPKTGELKGEFPSIREAARFVTNTAGAQRSIQFCLKGQHETAYGYKWRYAEESI